jgi:acetyltransferase
MLAELTELDINPLLADDAGGRARRPCAREREELCGRRPLRDPPVPDEFEETVQWAGQQILLRPIRPQDEEQHREFLASLDAEDIRLRLFYSRRTFERTELARLTQIDYEREMAFIAQATGPDGRPRTLGTVRAVADPDNDDAEFAIIVRSDLKVGYVVPYRVRGATIEILRVFHTSRRLPERW